MTRRHQHRAQVVTAFVRIPGELEDGKWAMAAWRARVVRQVRTSARVREEALMTRPNQHLTVTRAEEDRMIQLYRAGGSIVQVAGITGRSGTTVQRVLRQRGVPTRPPGARKADLPRLEATDPSLAFNGEWVRCGLILKPAWPEREAS